MKGNNQIASWNKKNRNKENNRKKINETKSWFFAKINKLDKPLFKLTKKQRENIQINKIRNVKGNITADMKEIHESSGHISKTLTPQNWKI